MSILDEMNFNPYAFVAPKTKAEYLELLKEASRMIDEIDQNFQAIWDSCEEARKNPPKE